MRKVLFASFLIICGALSVITPAWGDESEEARQNQQGQAAEGRDQSSTRAADAARFQNRLVQEIRHELVTLPYYDVFDWLEGQVTPEGSVVLRGQVVRPSTKSEATKRVSDIEGVERVDNQIEVLPVSPSDDRLRLAIYRAIFNWNSPLFRYATRSVPPIHIIVNRGRATLKGVVATEADKNIAYVRARGVPGLFGVTNELQVENSQRR
ncbi:MAG TPA: BON domain-containing protein [Blastocatellia bacterium]|jgi:hyperosmotically inducible protein|nr:BON domain-containing protein [Blastocatellia bacterium]